MLTSRELPSGHQDVVLRGVVDRIDSVVGVVNVFEA